MKNVPPHVGVASLCRTCPVSQGSGGGVLANEEEEHRAIEKRSIEQRSKPGTRYVSIIMRYIDL